MKNKLLKHTLSFIATMLACAAVTIGNPTSAGSLLGNPGRECTEADSANGENINNEENRPEISPQNDEDDLVKIDK